MALRIKTKFSDDLKRFLNNGDKVIDMAGKQTILDGAIEVLQNAQFTGKMSVDSGALRGSGYVAWKQGEAGFSTPYAAYNHEGINRFSGGRLNYPGGGDMKWLDRALDDTDVGRLDRALVTMERYMKAYLGAAAVGERVRFSFPPGIAFSEGAADARAAGIYRRHVRSKNTWRAGGKIVREK